MQCVTMAWGVCGGATQSARATIGPAGKGPGQLRRPIVQALSRGPLWNAQGARQPVTKTASPQSSKEWCGRAREGRARQRRAGQALWRAGASLRLAAAAGSRTLHAAPPVPRITDVVHCMADRQLVHPRVRASPCPPSRPRSPSRACHPRARCPRGAGCVRRAAQRSSSSVRRSV